MNHEPFKSPRLKRAELTSSTGALVLGVGLGATFASWFAPAATVITGGGLLLHAFGMWDKHRLESSVNDRSPTWVTWAYWTCWVLLGGVLVFTAWRSLAS
jgi:hypothetical protein